MIEEKKIKITYEDLENPKIDDIIARRLLEKKRMEMHVGQKIWIVHKKWLYLLLAGLIGAIIIWGAYKVVVHFFSPADKTVKIGNSV